MTKELTPQQARQGKTLHHMRYVLSISITLAVIALGAVYLVFFA